MSLADQIVIGLIVFGALMGPLVVLGAIADLVLGPDPDLRAPWDPRR